MRRTTSKDAALSTTSSKVQSPVTSVSDFVDPYVYPGTTVLKNRLGIMSHGELSEAEVEITWGRRQQLADGAVTGSFDFDHLCAIHSWLFQDIYEWAGLIRTVNISKGSSHFLDVSKIETGAQHTFHTPSHALLISGPLSPLEFVAAAADLLGDINYIHPFREGNGRTQRAFLDALAAHGGRELAWRNVSENDNIAASAASLADPTSPALAALLEKVIQPPHDGLSVLDHGVYTVGPPNQVSPAAGADNGLDRLRSYSGDV